MAKDKFDAIIGLLDYEACKDCKHGDEVEGGCKIDAGDDDIEAWSGDFIICTRYEKLEDEDGR